MQKVNVQFIKSLLFADKRNLKATFMWYAIMHLYVNQFMIMQNQSLEKFTVQIV